MVDSTRMAPRERPFKQVDVFTTTPYRGNPVAVVLDGRGLSDADMQRFAHWTNLSETTFVLPPTSDAADYRVRIFTPAQELPFAGHPTLGTCHAWLEAGNEPQDADQIVQECEAGLVPIKRGEQGLQFAAPPLTRSGPVDDALQDELATILGIERSQIVDAAWTDNGPGWVSLLLATPEEVLGLEPANSPHDIGVVAPHREGADTAFEVRAFFPKDGTTAEDPVTGSLNAGLAMWLTETGRATPPYVAAQGTALGRAGRVHVTQDDHRQLWVGGGTVTCIDGAVTV